MIFVEGKMVGSVEIRLGPPACVMMGLRLKSQTFTLIMKEDHVTAVNGAACAQTAPYQPALALMALILKLQSKLISRKISIV